MNISRRLIKIANMVDRCNSMADIGTDHGYIPIFLVQNKVCDKVIASDINKGPVEKAKRNIKKEGLEKSIECRLGSGLKILKPGEVQIAVVSGMGGHLIIDILEESIEVVKKLEAIVVQPVQNSDALRKYLYEKGYDILEEELCFEEGKFYEIVKVRYSNKPKVLQNIYYEIGPLLLEKKHELLKEFINYKIHKNNKIIAAIKDKTENAYKKKEKVLEKNLKLKGMLECL